MLYSSSKSIPKVRSNSRTRSKSTPRVRSKSTPRVRSKSNTISFKSLLPISSSKTKKNSTKIPQDILTYSLMPFLDPATAINLAKTNKQIYKKTQPTIKKNEYMKLIETNKFRVISKSDIINEFIPYLTYNIENQHKLNVWNFKNNNKNKDLINMLNSIETQEKLENNNLQYITDAINILNIAISNNSNKLNNDFLLYHDLKSAFNIFSNKATSFIYNSKNLNDYKEIIKIIKNIFFLFKQIMLLDDSIIKVDNYKNDIVKIENNFVNFIEKYFDIDTYYDFLMDNDNDTYIKKVKKNSAYLLIFNDDNNNLIFYGKKNNLEYLNLEKNKNLYNEILTGIANNIKPNSVLILK